MDGSEPAAADELERDIRLMGDLLGDAIRELSGEPVLALVRGLRDRAMAVRDGRLPRDELAAEFMRLDLAEIVHVARAFTHWFHLVNAAEEQHRIRTLRRRDRLDQPIVDSLAAGVAELKTAGASADDVRAALARMLVMPVITAHPTEARRRTVLDHLADIAGALDRVDGGRLGEHERLDVIAGMAESIGALYSSEESRAGAISPRDELSSALHVFDRTLLDATPAIYRELEERLAEGWPGEPFEVPPLLRWGTWIGGDRDGNPNVTADITRAAFERHRGLVLQRYRADVNQLLRALSVSAGRGQGTGGLAELDQALAGDRARLPEVAARAARVNVREPWREKLWYMRARLEATMVRGDHAYPRLGAYLDDLDLLRRTLVACGYHRLAAGRLHDCRRRAEVFGFHLASLDLRQHSAVHERAVDELLRLGGVTGYAGRDEVGRTTLLAGLLERADLSTHPERSLVSPETAELLATLEIVGRARRELGSAACQRYVVSFTAAPSDLLEVLFLARAAGLSPVELRPVPLLEQIEDLDRAAAIADAMIDLAPVRAALRGELEVMVGYSDSSKQAGYLASTVALRRAQVALAAAADRHGVMLTIFHGRGGAIGRGGGPESRAIRAQPPAALRGRIRVTEQGETVAVRYGRAEIARRDLEQMVAAVLVVSARGGAEAPAAELADRERLLDQAAAASRRRYDQLTGDRDRLVSYAVAATPIRGLIQLSLGSRPASRRPGLTFEDLRAIPWVFSWNQSRHGLPGWFGLGSALEALVDAAGRERARQLYRDWPFFRAMINNAQLALARADIDVAGCYAGLAGEPGRAVFELIRDEHQRTMSHVLDLVEGQQLLGNRPHLVEAVRRRNPYVDVLSHAQIELLRRLDAVTAGDELRAQLRAALFITINGIAAGLQTAG